MITLPHLLCTFSLVIQPATLPLPPTQHIGMHILFRHIKSSQSIQRFAKKRMLPFTRTQTFIFSVRFSWISRRLAEKHLHLLQTSYDRRWSAPNGLVFIFYFLFFSNEKYKFPIEFGIWRFPLRFQRNANETMPSRKYENCKLPFAISDERYFFKSHSNKQRLCTFCDNFAKWIAYLIWMNVSVFRHQGANQFRFQVET